MVKQIIYLFFFAFLSNTFAGEGVMTPQQRRAYNQLKSALNVKNKKTETILTLLPGLANPHMGTISGITPLQRLCEKGYEIKDDKEQRELFCKILDGIDSIFSKDDNLFPVIFHSKSSSDCFSFLFSHVGIRSDALNMQDEKGNTPLHYATALFNISDTNTNAEQSSIHTLVKLGADTTIKNKKGETALDIAKKESSQKVLSEESVREIQTEFYKFGKKLITFSDSQEEELVKLPSLHSIVQGRPYGFKPKPYAYKLRDSNFKSIA